MPEGRPVLVTVDDDVSVSRAVARDLRRRYGEHYRIVRAEDPQQALDALREVKLRGDAVAAILADYRMPGLNGIEFLEQAMDLFPRARRALLTAYADTEAAIAAINVVDVDHYLLKPWDPPGGEALPGGRLDARDVARAGRRARCSTSRSSVTRWSAPVARRARLPRAQPRALPVVDRRRRPRAAGCSAPPASTTRRSRWSSRPRG